MHGELCGRGARDGRHDPGAEPADGPESGHHEAGVRGRPLVLVAGRAAVDAARPVHAVHDGARAQEPAAVGRPRADRIRLRRRRRHHHRRQQFQRGRPAGGAFRQQRLLGRADARRQRARPPPLHRLHVVDELVDDVVRDQRAGLGGQQHRERLGHRRRAGGVHEKHQRRRAHRAELPAPPEGSGRHPKPAHGGRTLRYQAIPERCAGHRMTRDSSHPPLPPPMPLYLPK